MRKQSCCFTGHRKIPANMIEKIVIKLNNEIENLIDNGVTDFISGGALGFDQMAASLIVERIKMGMDIRLILALPCRTQDASWSEEQKKLYQDLLDKADEVIYVSEKYSDTCMRKRNYYMVEHSAYCICALLRERSGTGQTVRYAHSEGLNVINVAK